MSDPKPERSQSAPTCTTVEAQLMRLDLATEVLEGLDELGVDDRDQLQALMKQLERQIADVD